MIKEYKTLIPYMEKRKWYYVAGISSLLVTSGTQLLIPDYIRRAVDTIASGDFTQSLILSIVFPMIGLAVIVAAGRYGWRYWIHGAARRIEADLRQKMYDHATSLDRTFFQERKVGDLMSLYTNDLNAVRMSASMAFVAATDGIFMTIAILVILFSQNPELTLITILPLPFITIAIIGVGRLVGSLFKKVQDSFGELSRQSQEVFSGVRVIQSFVKEELFENRFAKANDDYMAKNLRLVRVWGFFFPAVTFLSGMTSLLLLRFGGEAILTRSFTAGDLVATLSYLQMLIWPMLGAGFTVNLLQRGAASLTRINGLLSRVSLIKNPPEVINRPESNLVVPTAIEFRSVSFSYPGTEAKVLRKVDFCVEAGTTLGIAGPIGSGKSTMLALMPRLYDTSDGTVLVDGIDVRNWPAEALRSQFGFVMQDTFLFSDTVFKNIGFGLDEPDDETVEMAAELSTITRDVRNFPEGWQTEIGERGITLSGGQKQRISISRAIAVDPDILVFDDSLSAVDAETEQKVLFELLKLRRNKTNIVVSHRVSTLAIAHKIIVVQNGSIVQSGSHEDLIRIDGFYQEIYRLQQIESRETKDRS